MADQLELLKIIEKNARLTPEEIAVMMGASAEEVKAEIAALTEQKIILGYTTEINWEKTYPEKVTALIEVRITPVRNMGFDHLANILSQYDKVKDCYLMSGGFDLMVTIEGKSLREVSGFVTDKLSTMESVLSTKTNFILKKYKEHGSIMAEKTKDERMKVSL